MMYTDLLLCPASFPWKYVVIIASESAVKTVLFSDTEVNIQKNNITTLCKEQLFLYFNQQLTVFNLPFYQQASRFCNQVYAQLITIPYGETMTYSGLAERTGGKNMARAVGLACSKNDISIIVPCHRVISASGKLTGYAGGLATKAWLLDHEKNFIGK